MAIRVGYIGVGRIGKLIAANVLKGGFPLMVYDLRQESIDEMVRQGAVAASSAKQLAESCDIIELSVVNDAQVEDVMLGPDGVLAGAGQGSIVVIHSTIEPETAVKMAAIAARQGVGVVDAPISGGPEGTIAQTLLYMVGGEEQHVERCRPVFETSGKTIIHMGAIGTGSMMRICHHVVLGLNRFAADEGLKLAKALGLDVATACKAIGGGEARSEVVDRYLEKYRDMPTGGQYRIAGIAIRLGFERGLPMMGPAIFQQLYMPTKAKG